MASVEENPSGGGHKKGPGVKKAKKLSTKIDMTPFVDVILLLIIFFVFTTTLSQPTTMDLNMPKDTDKKDEETKIKQSGALNILMGKDDALFFYEGELLPDGSNFKSASYSEIRDVIINKKKDVMSRYVQDPACEQKALAEKKSIDDCKQKDFFVVIKPTDEAKYKNILDILDEMTINKVARYALVKPFDTELDLVKVSEGGAAAPAPAATGK